jgi:hypothetical protein
VTRLTRLSEWLLRQPLVWGGLASMAFYALAVERARPNGLIAQAFAGGLWQFKAAAAWAAFAGLAALAMRAMAMAVEYGALERNALPSAPAEGQSIGAADELLAELEAAPRTFSTTYYGQRLRRALEFVRQRGSADAMEADLRLLAADDHRAVVERYAAVRMATQVTVLIGVAGVAAGMALALVGYAAKPGPETLPAMVTGVALACGGLVQAITLALIVVLGRFALERNERRLLAAVDAAVERELLGRFTAYGTERDPHLASVQKMCEKLLGAVEAATERHDAAIGKSLSAASRRWEDMAATASSLIHRTLGESITTGLKEHAHAISGGVTKLADDLQGTLVRHAQILSENIDQHTSALADALEHHSTALAESLEHHTAVMTQTESSLAAENKRHLADLEAALGEALLLNASRQEKLIQQSEDLLKEMQVALVEAAGMTVAQQEQLIKQSDVLLRVVDATGQVRKLEEALNSNLLALSTSHNFEQTVTSLAAAVQLLSVRLRQPAIVRTGIDLTGDDATSQAA